MGEDLFNNKKTDMCGNQDELFGTKSGNKNSELVSEEQNRNNNKSNIQKIVMIIALVNIIVVGAVVIFVNRQMTYDITDVDGYYQTGRASNVMAKPEDKTDFGSFRGKKDKPFPEGRASDEKSGFSERRKNQAPKIQEGIFDDFGISTKAFYMNGMQVITGFHHSEDRLYIASIGFQDNFELTKDYHLQWFRQVVDTLNKPGSSFFTFVINSEEANAISAEELKNSGEDVFYYINGKRSDKKYLVSAQATGYGIGESLTLSLIEQ